MKRDYNWISKYAESLKGRVILELGCGSGIDTEIISKYSNRLVSSDLAPVLNRHACIVSLDHSKPLPLKDRSFDVVVASLCLHYFKLEQTKEIIKEISRVMKPESACICRVNSYIDKNHGATGFPEIEPGLYNVDGQQKRFFTRTEIHLLWSQEFTVSNLSHKNIDRYERPKCVYEFSAIKK